MQYEGKVTTRELILEFYVLGSECMDTTALSADTITLLGEANSLWSPKELQCMSIETFAKTVNILCGLRRFNQSQLSVLKDKAKQVHLWNIQCTCTHKHTCMRRIAIIGLHGKEKRTGKELL